MMITNMKKKPIELYIHIPFCVKKCDYCDFLSFRALSSVHEAYVQQLIREIRAQSCYCTDCQVVSVFIGGGTPSLLEPSCISRIMETVFSCFQVEPEAEITIEANPGTLLGKKLPVYRQCGINRVSIGLQSADNTELKNLGRIHSFEEFLKSFQSARMAGFTNINIDLMSGSPGQTLESWKNTLKKVTMLKPEHISAYSLIIEEGTPFWNRFGEGACACDYTGPALPDEDTENKIYRFTRKFLQEQGFERYEISNYAKPGKECRHNIGYWTEVAYLGLGLGASSYMEGCRFTNEKDLDKYLALDFGEEDPEKRETALRKLWGQIEELSQAQRMEEFMFLGLRMLKGVSDVDFVRLFGVKMETVYGDVIRRLTANGLLKKEENNLALTEWGMDVSNFVLSEFLLG